MTDGLIMKDEGLGVQRETQAEVTQPWETEVLGKGEELTEECTVHQASDFHRGGISQQCLSLVT